MVIFPVLLTIGTADTVNTRVLVDSARAGTADYRDLSRAIADGFRPIGPESPAMGQHWVQIRRLMDGVADPARPAILTYIFGPGGARLAGVAYARALGPGEPDPGEPGGPENWHFHAGDLVDEATLMDHQGHGSHDAGSRIAVLHAWIWSENPSGMFTPDNWALPYVRAGLPVPAQVNPDASRALALGNGSVEFFTEQLARANGMDESSRAILDGILRHASERIRPRLRGSPSSRQLAAWWQQALSRARARLPAGLRQ